MRGVVNEAVIFGLMMAAVLGNFYLLETPGGVRTVVGVLISAIIGAVLYAGLLHLIGQGKPR